MGFAKSNLDYFYADGVKREIPLGTIEKILKINRGKLTTPNVVALKDIGDTDGEYIRKGTPFYLNNLIIPKYSESVRNGREENRLPIGLYLDEDVRLLTKEEIKAIKEELNKKIVELKADTIDANSRLEKIQEEAQKIGKEVLARTTDEKGLINKNNLIYWIIGGYIAYRILK